ncbi:MAG: carbohydrate binding domain-containing protein, partial [Lentisphaerota bacterium]
VTIADGTTISLDRAVASDYGLPFTVVDDDNVPPVLGGKAPLNLLQNPGFENKGFDDISALYWFIGYPDTNGAVWGNYVRKSASEWRSHSGEWEASIPGQWGPHSFNYGGWYQKVTNTYPAGTIWYAHAWVYNDAGWTSSLSQLKILFRDESDTIIPGNSLEIGFTPPGEGWTRISMVATSPASCNMVMFEIDSYDMSTSGALQFDDVWLGPYASLPFAVQVGGVPCPVVVTNGTNSVFLVTDGDLVTLSETNPLMMIFGTYDVFSGLSRGLSGASTQMNVSVENWLSANTTNYSEFNSSDAASTTIDGAASVWKWITPLDSTLVQSLIDAGSNRVRATVIDADYDRVGDRMSLSNQQFGIVRVVDDDSESPHYASNASTAPLGVWIGVSNVTPSASTTNAIFVVTDSDLALVGGTNLLLNPGFEDGLNNYVYGDNVAAIAGAAESGTRGLVFYGWTNATGLVFQDRPVTAGATYEFTVRARKEANFNAPFFYMKVEAYDINGASTGAAAETNIFLSADLTTSWRTLRQTYTMPAGTVTGRVVIFLPAATSNPLGDDNYNAYFDDWTFKPVDVEPMRLILNAFDAQSGLSRGTTDASSQMNVDVGAWALNDVLHYVAGESTLDSRLTTATNTWMWNSFNPGDIETLYQTGTNYVKATVFDADNDRANDRMEIDDQQFGILQILDDDTVAPTVTALSVVGTGGALDSQGSLVFFDFGGEELDTNASFTAERVTAGPIECSETIVAVSAGNPGYAVRSQGSWANTQKYWSVSISIDANFTMTVTNLVFHYQSNPTGPDNWVLKSSADGYASVLASSAMNNDSTWRTNSVVVSIGAVSGTTVFRLYGGSGASGGGNWYLDNLDFQGRVQALSGSGYVSDYDLANGMWTITGLVRDALSGVYAVSNELGPRYSIFHPNGMQILTNRAFGTGPTNGGALDAAVPIADTMPAVPYDEITLGTYTGYVYVTDYDNDRTTDSLTTTQRFTFTVLDDDVDSPEGGSVFQGLTNLSSSAHLFGSMMVLSGSNLTSSAGNRSNRTWYVTDMMMVSAALTNVNLYLNLYDLSGYYRSSTVGGSNMTVTVQNFVTNNYGGYNAALSSANTVNNPGATSVWSFSSFSDETMSFLIQTTSKVTVTATDMDNDRISDRLTATDRQVGYIAWRDNDPNPPLLQTLRNTNASLAVLLGGTGLLADAASLWIPPVPQTNIISSNQIFAVTDGQLANVSATNIAQFRFQVYDAGDVNVLGLQRGTTATTDSNGRTLTNTHMSVGTAILSNTVNFKESSFWSSPYSLTKGAIWNPTSTWVYTSFSYDQVGQLLTAGTVQSNKITLNAYDADNDRNFDQASAALESGWLVVNDDDVAAPVVGSIVGSMLKNGSFE